MRFLVPVLLLCCAGPAGMAQAQVINGESSDDAAYAPRPAARWHSPEAKGEVPGGEPQDDPSDRGARAEKPRD